jgi:hypothetical protein
MYICTVIPEKIDNIDVFKGNIGTISDISKFSDDFLNKGF